MDLLIIGVALYMFWPLILSYLPYDYYDETLPDEMIELSEKTNAKFGELEPNFQELLHNASGDKSYTFSKSSNRLLQTSEQIYVNNLDKIVFIESEVGGGYGYTGSGSILTPDGVILTNYHLVEDALKVVVATSDNNIYEVTEVLAFDENLDIAFLKIDAENLSYFKLGDSNNLVVGEPTFIIGHPEGFLNTLSTGVISGLRDYSSQNKGIQIQITNSISAGNSGGVLLNKYGELIGIPTWSLEYEDNITQVQNMNFAVPINSAIEILDN